MFKRILIVLLPALFIFHWLPMEILLAAGMILLALVGVVLVLFHLGVQDFQGY